jgi:hypothetical protein
MFARTGRLALLLIAGAPVTAMAQFSYAPGTSQYRLTTSMKGAQEAMGQRQEMESSSNQLITVAVARAGRDTLQVSTTLDSIVIVGPMGMTPPGVDKMRGARVVARVSPTGQVYAVTTPVPDSIQDAANLTYEMSNLLPKMRAGVAAGASWTDTTSRKVSQGGIELDRKTIAAYRVAGDTTIGGQKAFKVARTSKTTMSGSGAQGGQPMTVEGTSEGNGTMFVTSSGNFLGYTNQEKVNLKVLLAANGMEVGITQDATTKIEKVK